MRNGRIVGIVVLLALLAPLIGWPYGRPADPAAAAADREAAVPVAAGDRGAADAGPEADPRQRREGAERTATPPLQPATGEVRVHLRHADGAAAAGCTVLLALRSGGPFVQWQAVTDAAGDVLFARLLPGGVRVQSPFVLGPHDVLVRAGETTAVEIEIPAGLNVVGVVVGPDSRPVPGALVEAMHLARTAPQPLAIADGDGRFAVRGLRPRMPIAARAAGFTASPLRVLPEDRSPQPFELRLELGAGGGVVEGVVVDGTAQPVAGAVVDIGTQRGSSLVGGMLAPQVAAVITDEHGRFRAIGVPAGEQPVIARGAANQPWRGSCTVVAGQTVALRIELEPGATLQGTVRDADNRPLAGVSVSIRGDGLLHHATGSGADGRYRLLGLPGGQHLLTAFARGSGRAEASVQVAAGSATECDLQLVNGVPLRGRVLDEAGLPVDQATITCTAARADGSRWTDVGTSGADGRFVVFECPTGSKVDVVATGHLLQRLDRRGVDPLAGEVELRIRRKHATSYLVGCLVDPEGQPVRTTVHARSRTDESSLGTSDAAGNFRLGPLVAGEWQLYAAATGFADRFLDASVADGATVDLGRIAFAAGGTAVVLVAEGEGKDVTALIADAQGRTWSLLRIQDRWRSPVLAAGRHTIRLYGGGIAAQVVPVQVETDKETQVEVRLQPGIEQRCEFEGLTRVDARFDQVDLLRDGEVLQCLAPKRGGPGERPWVVLFLAPGSYSLQLVAGELRGEAEFTVGSRPAPTVVVPVR